MYKINKSHTPNILPFLHRNQFVMEYCGEVMDYKDFQERAELYDRENRRHYYFMTLRADEVTSHLLVLFRCCLVELCVRDTNP